MPGDPEASQTTAQDAVESALARVVRWWLRRDVTERVLAQAGAKLTIPDAWALAWVVERGPSRPSTLARQLAVEPQTLTTRLRTLTDSGLVRRAADPLDRRSALVEATEDGVRVYRAIGTARRDLLVDLLAQLPANDLSVLARTLTELAELLESR
jgi:DNA-binding MarR family transcriptional regulator